MSVTETVLIYGVIPLAVFLLFAALTLLPGRGKDRTKYRPGQPWTAETVWYEPHPDTAGGHGDDAHGDHHAAPSPGATAAALSIGERPHEPQQPDAKRRTAAGGARGTW
jgi:hypothetical protein